jgi:hypothetical protein
MQVLFVVDTRASQCYKTPQGKPFGGESLTAIHQRVRPQTCLAGQGCMAAKGIVM